MTADLLGLISQFILICLVSYPSFLIVFLRKVKFLFMLKNCRAIAPGFLDNDMFRRQTLLHVMKMSRTWDSTMSMIPKGGETIWGDLDWSPEECHVPSKRRQINNDTQLARQDETGSLGSQLKSAYYGRLISFGKDVAEAKSSEIVRIEFQVRLYIIIYESTISPKFIFRDLKILQL